MATIPKRFSLKEASKHITRDDCWVIIDGKVYDVTSYLDEHPGGDDVLLDVAGGDATVEFEDAGHSETARELMKDYCIGEIGSSSVMPELKIFSKKQSTGIADRLMDKTVQYWVFPVAIVSIAAIAGLLYLRKK